VLDLLKQGPTVFGILGLSDENTATLFAGDFSAFGVFDRFSQRQISAATYTSALGQQPSLDWSNDILKH